MARRDERDGDNGPQSGLTAPGRPPAVRQVSRRARRRPRPSEERRLGQGVGDGWADGAPPNGRSRPGGRAVLEAVAQRLGRIEVRPGGNGPTAPVED